MGTPYWKLLQLTSGPFFFSVVSGTDAFEELRPASPGGTFFPAETVLAFSGTAAAATGVVAVTALAAITAFVLGFSLTCGSSMGGGSESSDLEVPETFFPPGEPDLRKNEENNNEW